MKHHADMPLDDSSTWEKDAGSPTRSQRDLHTTPAEWDAAV